MKLLTDFDGTLTSIDREYAFEETTLFKSIRTICPDTAAFDDIFSEAQRAVLSAPEQFGWDLEGRISVFSDEDLFMTIAAQMMLLDKWIAEGRDQCRAIKSALEAAGTSFMKLTQDAHRAMNAEPLSSINTPEPETVRVLQKMLDRGDEIVVVSNSSSARIIEKLRWAGLDPVDHEANPHAKFRVRGHANKFAIDEQARYVNFAGRPVDTARSKYHAVIKEERPDVVTGDVFSLDIALPLFVAREDPSLSKMHLCLRQRSYTPTWALKCVDEAQSLNGPHLHVIQSFEDIDAILSNSIK